MADGSRQRSVADALAEVARWRTDEETRHNTELAEVDQEVASLQTGIENLKQQLVALARFREELTGKIDGLNTTLEKKNYEAVFGAMAGFCESLIARSDELAETERTRDAELLQTLDDPTVRNMLAEYKQFKETIEPTLASMPASYRGAMEQLGRKQRDELTERIGALGTEPIEYSGKAVQVDLLVAVDAPDGDAEVLMLVLPVQDIVHTNWQSRDEDLQTRFAARVMQAVFSTAGTLGIEGNQGVFGGHRGLLAVELELAGGDKNAVAEQFRTQLQSRLSSAPELVAAKVAATVRIIEVDHLLPPEILADQEQSA